MLPHDVLLQLKRWNTPTIYNGWEQITGRDIAEDAFNLEETRDFMPQMGPMVGYARTLVIEPSNPAENAVENWAAFRAYLAEGDYPKIVVVQDLDKPAVIGSLWGEVTSNTVRSLGCVGTITDGAIRDLDEMTNAGFKALARRLCVGHAHVCPVRWGDEVEVFGRDIADGDLLHADKHGFLAVKSDEESELLEAARFMDTNECQTVIPAARSAYGLEKREILERMSDAVARFGKAAKERFGRSGEH